MLAPLLGGLVLAFSWRVCNALEISIQSIGMMLLIGLSDSFPMADINGSLAVALAVAPSGTASSPVEPGVADVAPMLSLSHCDHASNGAKAAEPEFGTPVSPAFSPESGINYSSPYPQSPWEPLCYASQCIPFIRRNGAAIGNPPLIMR
jgi:hypothetical protein